MTDHPIEPGIYDMPEDQYFDFPAFSNSDLKLIARSPAHYWAAKRDPNREPEKETPAKLAGRAFHCAILEPSEFPNRYIKAPPNAPSRPTIAQINAKKPSESSIAQMEFWADFDAKANGRIVLKSDEYENHLTIASGIRSHPELAVLLKNGLAEKSVFAVDPETGLLIKCRTDYFTQLKDINIITDLKSSADARPFPFQRDAYKFGYFQQAAFYSDIWNLIGYPIDTWIITAFEKEAPYAVKLYEIEGADIEFGRKQYRQSLNIAAECHATDCWPAYDTDVIKLHIPGYASID
jgi:hypothetical protein